MADTVAAQIKNKSGQDAKAVGRAAGQAALAELEKRNASLAKRLRTAGENAGAAGAELGRTMAGGGTAFTMGVIKGYVSPEKQKYVNYAEGAVGVLSKGYALMQILDGETHMGVHLANGVGDGALFGLTADLGKKAGQAWQKGYAANNTPAAPPATPPATPGDPAAQGYEGYTDYEDATAQGDGYEGEDGYDVTPAAEGPGGRGRRGGQGGRGRRGRMGRGGRGGQGGRGGMRRIQQMEMPEEAEYDPEAAPPIPEEE